MCIRDRIYRDRSKRMIGLSQSTYINKVLDRFKMADSKRGYLPMSHGMTLSKTKCPKTLDERRRMNGIPYASLIGSIMYACLLYTSAHGRAMRRVFALRLDRFECLI